MEGPHVQLVEDRVLVPERVAVRCVTVLRGGAGHRGLLRGSSRSRARSGPCGGGGRCAPARAAGRAGRSSAARATGSGPRSAGRASGRDVRPRPRGASRGSSSQPDCVWWGSRFTTTRITLVAVGARLAVGDELLVVDRVELEAVVRLQRRVLAADAVEARDVVAEGLGRLQVPLPDLVLLGVEVLLAPLLPGRGDQQLEGGAVDPVARAQRGGEDEARHEGGPPAVLEVLGEDVRRVRPEVGAEELGHLACGSARSSTR